MTKHIDEMVLTGTNKVGNFFQQFIKTINPFLLNKGVNFIKTIFLTNLLTLTFQYA